MFRWVQRRASALQKEYEDKARKCDTEYGNTPAGTDGPVLQRLQSYGHVLDLVVGHFGEWSTGIKRLVTAAAEQARPRARALFGVRAVKSQKALLLSHATRKIAWAALNAAAKLRLDRSECVGPTAVSAMRRRKEAQDRWHRARSRMRQSEYARTCAGAGGFHPSQGQRARHGGGARRLGASAQRVLERDTELVSSAPVSFSLRAGFGSRRRKPTCSRGKK